jgi:hypothetical protein
VEEDCDSERHGGLDVLLAAHSSARRRREESGAQLTALAVGERDRVGGRDAPYVTAPRRFMKAPKVRRCEWLVARGRVRRRGAALTRERSVGAAARRRGRGRARERRSDHSGKEDWCFQ